MEVLSKNWENNVETTFKEILKRISAIDRDMSELGQLKTDIPADRVYSTKLESTFEKEIEALLKEKAHLLDLTIKEPPVWVPRFFSKKKPDSLSVQSNSSIPNNSPNDLFSYIQKIPKTEIHLHLEGCLNIETIKKIIDKNKINITENDLENVFNFRDLNGFIQSFLFVQNIVKSADDIREMAQSLADYLRFENIIYAEIFFAPSRLIQNGLDFFEMVDALVHEIRRIQEIYGIEIKVLVDISRSFGVENALKNLNNVLKLKYNEVIGIGLGGAELSGPARDYEKLFQIAKNSGLRTVAHAGEDDGPWSIWDSVEILGVERIGHGTSAIQDPRLVDYLGENQIPIEICLTSNIFTGKYVKKESNHPVRLYYDKGLQTVINTDDPAIFKVTLSEEYYKLHKNLDFTVHEIHDLIKKSVYSTFHRNKSSLWTKIQNQISELKPSYSHLF